MKKIIEKEADYVIQVKGNQRALLDRIKSEMGDTNPKTTRPRKFACSVSKNGIELAKTSERVLWLRRQPT